MANVGQLYYNLDDYNNSGQKITSSVFTQQTIYENFFGIGKALANQAFKKLGIQAPPGTVVLIGTASDQEATAQRVMIGRTGIYEMEDDEVYVKYFRFEKQYQWIYDENGTTEKRKEGERALKETYLMFNTNKEQCNHAEYYILSNSNDFTHVTYYLEKEEEEEIYFVPKDKLPENTMPINYYKLQNFPADTTDYWSRYDIIFNDYALQYEAAYGTYLQGVNGVYKRIETNNEDEPFELLDPQNVIIDYITV